MMDRSFIIVCLLLGRPIDINDFDGREVSWLPGDCLSPTSSPSHLFSKETMADEVSFPVTVAGPRRIFTELPCRTLPRKNNVDIPSVSSSIRLVRSVVKEILAMG